MEFYTRLMALTGDDANTTMGAMAMKVLRLLGHGTQVDKDIIEWACYIVADSAGHPSDPGYDEKVRALES